MSYTYIGISLSTQHIFVLYAKKNDRFILILSFIHLFTYVSFTSTAERDEKQKRNVETKTK